MGLLRVELCQPGKRFIQSNSLRPLLFGNADRFFHDYRPKCGIRVSPHFYTTDKELDRFMSAVDAARS